MNRIRVKSIFEYLLVFLMFIEGQTVWIRYIETNRFYVLALAGTFSAILCIGFRLRPKNVKKGIMVVILLTLYAFFTRNTSSIWTIVLRMMIPFFVFEILCGELENKQELLQFIKKYSNIVVLFSGISLFCYLFGTLLNLLPKMEVTFDWAGRMKTSTSYFHLLYEAQEQTFFSHTFVRNCGIFAEGTGFAVPLMYSAFYELFVPKKVNVFRIFILTLTVITTWSTKAFSIYLIIIALRLFIYLFFEKPRESGFVAILKLITPIVLIVVVAVAIDLVSDRIDASIQRADNLYCCYNAFMDNKLFGVGVENEAGLTVYSQYNFRWAGYAMGVAVLIGEGGIFLSGIYLYGIINAIKNCNDKKLIIAFNIVSFAILFTSNIPYFMISIFILALNYSFDKRSFLLDEKIPY